MVILILIGSNHTSCEISGVLKVPMQQYDNKVFSFPWNSDNDIYLTWSHAGENSFKGFRIMLLIIVCCVWLIVA